MRVAGGMSKIVRYDFVEKEKNRKFVKFTLFYSQVGYECSYFGINNTSDTNVQMKSSEKVVNL